MGASAPAQGRASRGRTLGILTLGIVLGLGVAGAFALWLWRHLHPVAHEVFAAKQPPSPPRPSVLPTPIPATVVPTPTPTPTLAFLPRPPAATPAPAKTAAESYQRARAKHPALDFPDTPFCKQFVAEIRRLKSRRDPLMENPSHPEIVADKLGRQLVRH